MRRKLRESRILLTGASSGIGWALALQLAAEGADLVVTARRRERLEELVEQIRREHPDYHEGGARNILAVAGDITDADTRSRCIETALERLGGLDLLINNAGVGATATVEATEETVFRRMMEVNYFALVALTRSALPLLKTSAASPERKGLGVRPMIVNFSSVVGLRGTPHYGAYGAAKFAVTGISDALRAELARDEIDVLLVAPGTTATEFFDVRVVNTSEPKMPRHPVVTSEYVASRTIRAIKSGKHRIIPYFLAVVIHWIHRLSPGIADAIMKRYA